MTLEVCICPIAEEYIAGFHACLDTVARERAYLAQTSAPPLERVQEFVRSVISKGQTQLVALDGQKVVGWIDILPMHFEGFTHVGHLGMGVLASYRGRGIGKRLMLDAIADARSKGIERVELEVYASNKPAIELYKKVGFEIEGVKR
ncbi:MAG: GNAT family N-acetyltransferase, partial [Burkholderiales bacterium]|nr:GNAT family N-acetyltransferase [Anaerolineae bacterium]